MNKNKNVRNGVRQKNKFSCHWIWTGRRFICQVARKTNGLWLIELLPCDQFYFMENYKKTKFWHLKISHDIKNKAYSEGYLRLPHVTRHSN